MKKRLTSLLIVLCLVLALVPTAMAASAADFTDVKEGTWYYDYVNEVVSKGYFKGESSTIFSPDKQMTRAMFVTVLSRVDGATVNDSKSTFDDVPVNQWYTGAVTWANENKIVLGTGGKNFEPNRAISRIDMCLIMSRYISYYAAKTGQVPATTSSGKTFSDISGLDAEAKAALDRCVTYGLIEGTPEGTFKPYDTATRAEVAAVISRLAWTTTGGGGVIPIVSSITYYQNQYPGDPKNATRTGIGTLLVLDFEDLEVREGFAARDGYTFDGWNEDPNGNGKVYKVGAPVTGVVTLYAQWEKIPPKVADHINEAVENAAGYASDVATKLKDAAFEKLYILAGENKELKDIIGAAESETSIKIDCTSGRKIDVTLNTNASDTNVAALADFATTYALNTFTGSDQSAGGEAKDLYDTLRDRIKELLADLNVEIEGSNMTEKIENAANSLADLAKTKAKEYRDELKKIFKNVADDKSVVEDGTGTASVTAATVKVNGEDIITLEIDKNPTREELKNAATKAHEAVQHDAKGHGYMGIYELADEHITGTVIFTPASTIATNYTTDEMKTYTVKFKVTTGTDNYLQYKYEGGSDYYKIIFTKALQDEYKKALDETVNTIWAKLVESGKINLNVSSKDEPTPKKRITLMAAPKVSDPGTSASSDKTNMFDKLRDAFKQLKPDEEVNPVDKALDQWIKDNSGVGVEGSGFTDSAIFDILTSEDQDIDASKLDNSAFNELIDIMAEELGKKLADKAGDRNHALGYEAVETLLDAALDQYKDDEYKKEFVDFYEEYSKKDEYAGLFVYVEAKAGDYANKKLSDNGKFEPTTENLVDTQYTGDKYRDNEAVKDKVPAEALDQSITSMVQENVGDVIDEVVKENETVQKLQSYLKKVKNNNTLKDAEKVTVNRAIAELKSLKDLVSDESIGLNLDRYMGRLTSVASKLNNAINKLLSSRFGTNAKSASITIGTAGEEVTVEKINDWLTKVAETENIDSLIEKLEAAASGAGVGELSLSSFYDNGQVITAKYGTYTYSFHLVAELANN